MRGGWNYAEVWEAVARRLPDAPAQRHAGSLWTWREFDERADAIAAHLLERGVVEQDKVAQYLYNAPEYLESVFAAFKAGLAVVNTNYRYTPDELTYLWDNADVVAVVFHGAFADQCATVRGRLPRIHTWLWVDDGSGPCPAWATPYAAVTSPWPGRTMAPWGRHGDHLLLLYTGGTTGMPKGVMWRQDDLFRALDQLTRRRLPLPADANGLAAQLDRPGPSNLPAAPLMHGTGLVNALTTLSGGGSIVTLAGRHFDPDRTPRHGGARRSEVDDDRRRRLRPADPAGPRCRPVAMGHLVAARHRLVRRDVVEGDQGWPAPPQ